MKYVPARVGAKEAQAFFRRRRWGNLFGLLWREQPAAIKKTPESRSVLPRIEKIWIPHYQIDFRVTARSGPGTVSVSVEACSGCFAIFQMHDALVEGALGDDYLPALIEEQEAVQQGRRQLLQAIMRRRGQQGKPVIEEALGATLFYYPFWLYYFRRRGKFIDIRLLDAFSAERGGSRTRQGILNAFVAQRGTATSRLS